MQGGKNGLELEQVRLGEAGFGRIYRASVRTLFNLLILDETLRSMVRSPISTISPPMASGLTYVLSEKNMEISSFHSFLLSIAFRVSPTFVTTFNFLPWLYSDLATALSRRCMVLMSSSWANQTYISWEKPLRPFKRTRTIAGDTPKDDKISHT